MPQTPTTKNCLALIVHVAKVKKSCSRPSAEIPSSPLSTEDKYKVPLLKGAHPYIDSCIHMCIAVQPTQCISVFRSHRLWYETDLNSNPRSITLFRSITCTLKLHVSHPSNGDNYSLFRDDLNKVSTQLIISAFFPHCLSFLFWTSQPACALLKMARYGPDSTVNAGKSHRLIL